MTVDVERVLAGANLVDLCQADVVLRRVGLELHGACPFCVCSNSDRRHQCDRFRINRDRDHWYCRHCRPRGGNAIDFAMSRYNLDFLRACLVVGGEHTASPVPAPRYIQEFPDKTDRTPPPHPSQLSISPLVEGDSVATYLAAERGIPLEFARRAGVGGARFRFGSTAVDYAAFPFLDRAGHMVACQYRAITTRARRIHHAVGPKSAGVFPSGKRLSREPVLAIVEAPIDALSLAIAGCPAIALGGSGYGPDWLPDLLGDRLVLLAHDADPAGDAAAAALQHLLAHSERMRPSGHKDWNGVLKQIGLQALQQQLREMVRGLPCDASNQSPVEDLP